MTNVRPIIENIIVKPLHKQGESVASQVVAETEKVIAEPQKIYAQNLNAIGVAIRKNFSAFDKAQIDSNAEKFITKFFDFLQTQSTKKATEYVLTALNKNNFKFVEALSIDIRKYDDRITWLKNIVGEENFNTKVFPVFKQNYSKYLEKLWSDERVSLDYLFSLRPDWSFKKVMTKMDFTKTREFGKIPENFIDGEHSSILFNHLSSLSKIPKSQTLSIPDLNINGINYKIHRFTDGANKEGVFLVNNGNKEFVVKINKAPYMDSEIMPDGKIKAYPSREIFLDYYLTKNNCTDVPKLHYYKFDPDAKSNIAVYDYVKPDEIITQNQNVRLEDLEKLKVRFNDTIGTNNIIYKDGKPYCVDNDDSIISMPFDLYNWNYHYTKMSALTMPY